MKKILLIALLLSSQLFAATTPMAPAMSPELKATYADITATMGLVPTFMKVYPPAGLPGEWQVFKNVDIANTAVPGKYKELIGLAVAAQIPCTYCVYAHTQFAKLNGATTAEIEEAIAVAATEREWSTIVNSNPIGQTDFFVEVDAIMSYMRDKSHIPPMPAPGMTATQKDIQLTFGRIPSFIRSYPSGGIDGAWATFKVLIANPTSAIPNKYKDLIAFAVASQIPCPSCVYMDRGFAKLDGASDQELTEAAGMAALARHWSTIANGNQLDYTQFKNEINQIVSHVKKAMAKAKQ